MNDSTNRQIIEIIRREGGQPYSSYPITVFYPNKKRENQILVLSDISIKCLKKKTFSRSLFPMASFFWYDIVLIKKVKEDGLLFQFQQEIGPQNDKKNNNNNNNNQVRTLAFTFKNRNLILDAVFFMLQRLLSPFELREINLPTGTILYPRCSPSTAFLRFRLLSKRMKNSQQSEKTFIEFYHALKFRSSELDYIGFNSEKNYDAIFAAIPMSKYMRKIGFNPSSLLLGALISNKKKFRYIRKITMRQPLQKDFIRKFFVTKAMNRSRLRAVHLSFDERSIQYLNAIDNQDDVDMRIENVSELLELNSGIDSIGFSGKIQMLDLVRFAETKQFQNIRFFELKNLFILRDLESLHNSLLSIPSFQSMQSIKNIQNVRNSMIMQCLLKLLPQFSLLHSLSVTSCDLPIGEFLTIIHEAKVKKSKTFANLVNIEQLDLSENNGLNIQSTISLPDNLTKIHVNGVQWNSSSFINFINCCIKHASKDSIRNQGFELSISNAAFMESTSGWANIQKCFLQFPQISLTRFSFDGNQLSKQIISILSKCSTLEYLSINNCVNAHNIAHICKLIESTRSLKILNMKHSTGDIISIIEAVSNSQTITKFDFSFCSDFDPTLNFFETLAHLINDSVLEFVAFDGCKIGSFDKIEEFFDLIENRQNPIKISYPKESMKALIAQLSQNTKPNEEQNANADNSNLAIMEIEQKIIQRFNRMEFPSNERPELLKKWQPLENPFDVFYGTLDDKFPEYYNDPGELTDVYSSSLRSPYNSSFLLPRSQMIQPSGGSMPTSTEINSDDEFETDASLDPEAIQIDEEVIDHQSDNKISSDELNVSELNAQPVQEEESHPIKTRKLALSKPDVLLSKDEDSDSQPNHFSNRFDGSPSFLSAHRFYEFSGANDDGFEVERNKSDSSPVARSHFSDTSSDSIELNIQRIQSKPRRMKKDEMDDDFDERNALPKNSHAIQKSAPITTSMRRSAINWSPNAQRYGKWQFPLRYPPEIDNTDIVSALNHEFRLEELL